jgi:two-component system response regulator HupR/HoxA
MQPPPSRARVYVLVVDDDPALLETTAALLGDDFDVATAANADEALAALESNTFDVLCTDFRMPGMDGLSLLQTAQRRHPWLCGILVTAYADRASAVGPLPDGHLTLLKPYRTEQLVSAIGRAAALGRMRRSVADASATVDRLKGGAWPPWSPDR